MPAQFYVLVDGPNWDNAADTDALKADGTNRGEAPRCPACCKYTGMRSWLPPYRVELETWGSEFGDLAFLGGGDDILVSLRFKQLWNKHRLVGLSGFEPVKVLNVTRNRKIQGDPPAYFKAAVVASQAIVDFEASGYEWLKGPPTCSVCRIGDGVKRWKGTVVDPATWRGEDIFVPRATADFVTSERFKDFCEANAIKNAVLVPAETHGHDFYPGGEPDA